jgi:hypothetical protein
MNDAKYIGLDGKTISPVPYRRGRSISLDFPLYRTYQDVGTSKNLQVCNYLTGLYSADSKLVGAHADPPRQTSRALRNPLRYRCGWYGRGL